MRNILIALLVLITFKTEAQTSVLTVSDSLMANGNFSKAIALLENSNTENSAYRLARAYNAIGNYDKSILSFKKAIESTPENTLLQYEYAKLLSKVKKNTEAVTIFNNLKATDSTNPNYHYELGVVLERLKQTEEAQNSFNTTYKLDKTHQKAIYKLAKYSLKSKAFERLDTLVAVGLNSYPKNAALTSLKAQSLYLLQDYTNAIVWFENLLELGERSQFIFEKLSFAYRKDLEYKKAIENLKQALLFQPKNAENLYKLGGLYQLVKDYKNAEKYIKQSLEIQDVPLNNEYRKLATVYNRLEKPQIAIKYFKKALKENPDDEFAKFYLVIAKSSYYKDMQSKIELFNVYIKNNPESMFVEYAKRERLKLKQEAFLKVEEHKEER
ncbi:tetratricopeptide repeat protein [Lacinutrix mariniflava]|uniref:tetratricopeptide repeat protein n=1 Tax=Lacinutrix mariniflava TaxID=342955 RepID=UPI0006E266B6|nr:tetratricopeptide repeat protein [Lacinutrix mariniflava]